MTTESQRRRLERLQDVEYRAEFGAENFKYDMAYALAEARRMKGLTQQALAELAGVSQEYISKLEGGRANPTIGRMGSILATIWLKPKTTLGPLSIAMDEMSPYAERTTRAEPSAVEDEVLSRLAASDDDMYPFDWRQKGRPHGGGVVDANTA